MVMDEINKSLKIAVLFDLDSVIQYHAEENDGKGLGQALNAIKVATLRYLTSALSHGTSYSNIQWAYSIFSQNAEQDVKRIACKRLKFMELSFGNFCKFEKDICACNNDKVIDNHDTDPLDSQAKQIRLALSNTVLDLPWIPPILASPVKGRGYDPSEHIQSSNHVLLFSHCPKDSKNLCYFASYQTQRLKDKKLRIEHAIDEMLPKKLLHTLHEESKISLHVVDLSPLVTYSANETFHGNSEILEYMEAQLKPANGSIVPINVFVKGGLEYVSFANVLEDRIENRQYESSSTDTIAFCFSDREATLFIKCYEYSVQLSVVLTSIFNNLRLPVPQTKNQNPNERNTFNFVDLIFDKNQSKNCHSNGSYVSLQGIATTTENICYEKNRNMGSPICFVVPSKSQSSFIFEAFIKHLLQSQLWLVVEVQVGENAAVCRALLEPLSPLCALLRVCPLSEQVHCQYFSQDAHPSRNLETHGLLDRCVSDVISKMPPTTLLDKRGENETDADPCCEGRFSKYHLCNQYNPSVEPNTAHQLFTAIKSDTEEEDTSDMDLLLLRKLQKKQISMKSVRITDSCKTKRPHVTKASELVDGHVQLRRSPRKKCSTAAATAKESAIVPPRHPLKKSRSVTAPTRTDQLWQACRKQLRRTDSSSTKINVLQGDEAAVSAKDKGSHAKSLLKLGDMNSEEDLLQFLTTFYTDVLGSDMSIINSAQSMLNTSSHFFKTQNTDIAERQCYKFISQILTDNNAIKQKYKVLENKEMMFKEYEFQIILHTELETMASFERDEDEVEEKVTKVAGLLRAMSFLSDPEFVSRYMKTVMLHNYVDTAPMFLSKVYDEMLLPLPEELEVLMSPDLLSCKTHSVNPPLSVASNASSANSSFLPPSNRPQRDQKMNRYRSFHAVPTRQISVPKADQKKTKKAKSEKPTRVSRRIASSVKKSAKKRAQAEKVDDSKKVRKNLFGVNVESSNTGKTNLQRRRSCVAALSTQPESKTPKRQSSHKRRIADTPAHKQTNKMVWRRQEKERRRTHTASVDTTIIAESPDKRLTHGAQNATPKKSKLMKNRSFYSDNVDRAEKLEARLVTAKVLSPTWNAPKFGSLLQKTPPRRVTPRTLFQNLMSPSPQKMPAVDLLKSPLAGSQTLPFSLGKAVAALNFAQSPSKSTRSQQSGLRAFSDAAGDKFERVFTPHGKNILKTPVKNTNRVLLEQTTPTSSTRRKIGLTPKQNQTVYDSAGIGRRVSFSTTLFSPQKEIAHTWNPFQSPSKSILTPIKHSTRRIIHENEDGSQLRPIRRLTTICAPLEAQIEEKKGQGWAVSSGLDSSSSDNSAQTSPRTTSVTSEQSISNKTPPNKNIRSLFGSNLPVGNDAEKANNESDPANEGKENIIRYDQEVQVNRRTLRSKRKSDITTDRDQSITQVNESKHEIQDRVKVNESCKRKRKQSDSSPTTPHKRSRSCFSGEDSFRSLLGVNLTDHNEVFLEESVQIKSRLLEGITKSSLLSDNSNSALSFAEFGNLGSDASEIKGSTISWTGSNLLPGFEEEETRPSPVFGPSEPLKPLPLRLLSMDYGSDSSQPSSPVLQTQPTTPGNKTHATDNIPVNKTSAITPPASSTRSKSITLASNSDISTQPRCSPIVARLQSPAASRLQSPSANKIYSPLSTKGLVQLTESPILEHAENHVEELCSPKATRRSGSKEAQIDVAQTTSPVQKRAARRSLYRTQTNMK